MERLLGEKRKAGRKFVYIMCVSVCVSVEKCQRYI